MPTWMAVLLTALLVVAMVGCLRIIVECRRELRKNRPRASQQTWDAIWPKRD